MDDVDERKQDRGLLVDENCSATECAAFSVTPEEGFKNGGDHSILFDHTLISGSDVTSGITFRCGNIMALSAPSKGLPQEGGDGAKYMSFFLEHGQEITKAWFKEVNEKLTDFYGQNKNIYTKIPKNYKEIDNLNLGKDEKGNKLVSVKEYQDLHDILAEDLPSFLKTHIFDKSNWELKEKEAEIKKKLNDYFLGDDAKNSGKYKDAGRLDKAYQLLFYNDLWQTQKFGGFDAGKDGPYGVFYGGLVDKTRKMKEAAAEKLKEFIEQSIEGVDVLFLCESVHHLDKILGVNYTCVSIEKAEDEIYSAICKKKEDSGIDIVAATDTENAEFGIFTINKGENSIKVAVVHTKEKVKKEGKKLVGPLWGKDDEGKDVEGGWDEFVEKLGDVNYMVGDTNMTAKKSKLTDDGEGGKQAFWEGLARVENAVVPTRPIKKVRLGKSVESNVNGFLNNQINKGGKKESEVDGMVILKLSGGGGDVAAAANAAAANAAAAENAAAANAAAAAANAAEAENAAAAELKEGQGGGRRRRRRKTKKKRKSKRKSKRKRKPKRKTKRKRKRRRTKKR